MNVQRQTAQRLADNLQAFGLDDTLLNKLSDALEEVRRADHVRDTRVLEEINWDYFPTRSRKATRTIFTRWGITTNGLLQLVSEKEFGDLLEIGSDRVGKARSYLIDQGCGFRPHAMPFVTRAYELYGGVAAVPISILLTRLCDHVPYILNEYQLVRRLEEEGVATLGEVHDRCCRNFATFQGLVGGEDATRWLQGYLAAMF